MRGRVDGQAPLFVPHVLGRGPHPPGPPPARRRAPLRPHPRRPVPEVRRGRRHDRAAERAPRERLLEAQLLLGLCTPFAARRADRRRAALPLVPRPAAGRRRTGPSRPGHHTDKCRPGRPCGRAKTRPGGRSRHPFSVSNHTAHGLANAHAHRDRRPARTRGRHPRRSPATLEYPRRTINSIAPSSSIPAARGAENVTHQWVRTRRGTGSFFTMFAPTSAASPAPPSPTPVPGHPVGCRVEASPVLPQHLQGSRSDTAKAV